MASEMVVQDALSLDGIRRLHVMRMGGPVDLARWMERVPVIAEATLARVTWQEEALGVHHLQLVWRARELVNLQIGGMGLLPAVMWGIDRMVRRGQGGKKQGPQTVRQAIDEAAGYYELMTGELPSMAMVASSYGEMVAQIKERLHGEPVYSMRWDHPTQGRQANELVIRLAEWAPVGSVIICRGGEL